VTEAAVEIIVPRAAVQRVVSGAAEERKLLRTIMTEAELRDAILPEYGYTTPRLGILADGTWWFFILEGGP
jgi:hypothetical protein